MPHDEAALQPEHDTATAVLDAAHLILVTEGLSRLSVRNVAKAAGYTTMVVYSHFGGKDGIVDALFARGFAYLAAAQNQVPADLPPAERVQRLCRAFVDLASERPHYFQLMFGGGGPEYEPSPASRQRALQTLRVLEASIRDALPENAEDRAKRSSRVARQVFSLCYGWAALRHVGMLESVDVAELDEAVRKLLQ